MAIPRTLCISSLVLCALAIPSRRAAAQDESSPAIELGSSRIGGPGLSERERKWVKSWDEPEEYLTEETLPKPGDNKRLPAQHTLALRYVTTKQWKEACGKFDAIESEFGMEGVAEKPDGKTLAARAYLHCAKTTAARNEFDKAEALLQKSEKYGPNTPKHEIIREKMLREQYRKRMGNGDVDGAIKLFDQAQKMRDIEDERIWMGEQLAERAWEAFKADDKITLEMLMRRLDDIAPMNTEYRQLKEKLEGQQGFVQNALMLVGAVIGFIVLWNLFARWREAAKVKRAAGNPFDDDL